MTGLLGDLARHDHGWAVMFETSSGKIPKVSKRSTERSCSCYSRLCTRLVRQCNECPGDCDAVCVGEAGWEGVRCPQASLPPPLFCSLLVVLVSSGLWSYCRHLFLSGRHDSGRELRYYPFRLTPYLTKVRDSDSAEGQPCCLLIAERIHSGYEGKGEALPTHCGVGGGRSLQAGLTTLWLAALARGTPAESWVEVATLQPRVSLSACCLKLDLFFLQSKLFNIKP